MNVDTINLTLGNNFSDLLEILEVDSSEYVETVEGLRGPTCCHGGDNPTGFTYYEEPNAWFCWTANCHEKLGSDMIGLIATMKDVSRIEAIKLGRKYIEVDLKGIEVIKATKKPKREVVDHTKLHLEQETYHESILDRLRKDYSYATGRGFNAGVLARMGVGISNYGVMDGRLVFPVKNIEGNVVGFSGRALVDDGPKWRHSRFKKSINLFNIDKCKEAMDRWDMSTVVLVEGPWDVVKLCQTGFWNSMAIMGSSLTNGQVEILKNMGVNKAITLLDNDSGGRNAEAGNVNKLERALIDVEVVYPPEEGSDAGDMSEVDLKKLLRGRR